MSAFRLSIDLKNVCALFLRIRSALYYNNNKDQADNFSSCSVWAAALPWCFRPPGLLSLLDQRPRLSSTRLRAAAPASPTASAATSASASAAHPAKHPEQAEAGAH